MTLKISEVVEFLERVKQEQGDLRIETLTGFWVRDIPSTGERIVVCVVGDGKPLEDVVHAPH